MKNKAVIILSITAVMILLALGLNWGMYALADVVRSPTELSPGFTYQGYLEERGLPADGIYNFSFEIFDAEVGGESWGLLEVTHVEVVNGIFTVILEFDPEVFRGEDRWLEIGVDPEGGGEYLILEGRQKLTPTPYAFYADLAKTAGDADTVDGFHGAALEESAEINADIAAHAAIPDSHHSPYTDGEAWTAVLTNDGHGSGLDADMVDGLHASELETHYENVVVVAKSGGDYTSVQTAINNITDASASYQYLVWVAPGIYDEVITMRPYVHLQGAGQEATMIRSAASSAWPVSTGTLKLAYESSLRDLTLENNGTGERNAALWATDGMTGTIVADVTVRTMGGGTYNYGIFLTGSDTGVTLHHVTALAENATTINYGLYNNAETEIHSGSFSGKGGTDTRGIYNYGSDAILDAENTTATGENGSNDNSGIYNYYFATARLRGGSYKGRGGVNANGVYNRYSSTTLEAEDTTAQAEEGTDHNRGLYNFDGSTVNLYGGTFTGRGGQYAYGISNAESSTSLVAESVTALGENGNYYSAGLINADGAEAKIYSSVLNGSVDEDDFTYAFGINNWGEGSDLETENVTALGENGTGNYGLFNYLGPSAKLLGGSFTGQGGTDAIGIQNELSGTTLIAEGVSALGENGSGENIGLYNLDGAAAKLSSGTYTGRSDELIVGWFSGIYNDGSVISNTVLIAENVTALGENGNTGIGLYNWNANATLHGGFFFGRGWHENYGIYNYESDARLSAENISSLAENGSNINWGFSNRQCAHATIQGSIIKGRGGDHAYGIENESSGSCVVPSTINVENTTSLGENGVEWSVGLSSGGLTSVRGGVFRGNGGETAAGILASGTFNLQNAYILGENGTIDNCGFWSFGGNSNITLSMVKGSTFAVVLNGGNVYLNLTRVEGMLSPGITCTAVSSGTTFPIFCP